MHRVDTVVVSPTYNEDFNGVLLPNRLYVEVHRY